MITAENNARQAFVVSVDGVSEKLQRIPFMSGSFNEAWLQSVLEKNPSIIPSSEFGVQHAPLVCIGREVEVGSSDSKGYIDNLYISPSGFLTIVETKLFRNQESRRTVVAQIIDYAKEVQKWDSEKLNNIASDYFYKTEGQASSIIDVMVRKGYMSYSDEGRLNDSINMNLQTASFLLLIVGDGIRTSVQQLVDFLNDNTSMCFSLGLVELEVYHRESDIIIIPNILTKSTLISRYVSVDESNEKSSPYIRKPILSRKEFITVFSENGGYDPDELTEFILDLEAVQGISIQIAPTELTVRFSPADGYSYALLTLSISRNHADLWIMPGRIQSALDKHGIFSFEATPFLDFFKDFVDVGRCKTEPYLNIEGFYYANIGLILNKKNEFIAAVEDFSSSITTNR